MLPFLRLILASILWIHSVGSVETFHSPFTARPLRIRLVNYERQFLPAKHVATPAEEIAERLAAPHAHNMPSQPSSFSTLQQNDEPIQRFAGGSYLQEVRRRMRVSGGKIHTPSTALTIPHISSETPETTVRRLSPIATDVRKLFDNEELDSENQTRIVTRRISPSTPLQKQPTTLKSLPLPSSIPTTTLSSITSEPSTTPVKVRPVLPREDIVPLDEDTDKPKNVSLQPLSELEIKSDFALQKSLQRTTIRTEIYTERQTTPSPKIKSSISTTTSSPIVFTLPTLFPALPDQTIGQLLAQNGPSIVNASLGQGFPPFSPASQLNLQPQQLQQSQQVPQETNNRSQQQRQPTSDTLEQLGCGFDLLTQRCQDVFALGWCSQCVDLGNVFLHDCKCSAATPLGRTANALFTSPTTPLPSHQNSFLPTQPTWTRN